MTLEIGKKYTDGCTVLEVKFFDYQGTAWCLSNRNCCKYIYKNEINWREVVDKPDPGEGWRLLHPDEDVEQGDEFFDKCNRVWLIAIESEQYKDRIYRRRTTPQYVPYTWDDRDELRGRWYRQKNDGHEQVAYYLANRDSGFRINSYLSEEFLDLCEWLDGTPCGKVVV